MMRPALLGGSRSEGTLQVAESAINDVVALMDPTATRHPTVELLPHNMLMVRYGLFHARAGLPRRMETGESPRLTLTLASALVAFGLRAVVHAPFIEIHGREVTIHPAQVPALSAWRDLWKYLQQLTFETARGSLRIGFAVSIDEHVRSVTSDDAGMV